MQQFDTTLNALIATSTEALRLDPSNQTLRTGILQNQVKLTAGQLGITQTQAANVVRSYTSAYAYSKGQDPKAILDALNSAQQQILNYDANKPTLYGVDLVTANKLASYFAAAAGPILALSIVAFTVALFMIGPEMAAAVAGAGGLVEALGAVTGVAVGSTGGAAIAVGTFLFLISQFLGHMSSTIPMITKQMVDNGTIAASLQITAIKNVAEVSAQLTGTKAPGPYNTDQFNALYNGLAAVGFSQIKNPLTGEMSPFTKTTFAQLINTLYGQQVGAGLPATPSKITPLINAWLYKGGSNNPIPVSLYDQVLGMSAPVPSTTTAGGAARPTTTPAASGSATGGVAPATNIQIYTGVISGGTLGLPQEFHAQTSSMISSIDELTTAAQINLAAAVQSLPGRFYYEIGIVNSVHTKSGFEQKGAPVTIVTGTYKNGKPKTKTIYMKFAQMKLGVTDENGRTVHLATINLGPVDVTVFAPSAVQLKDVQSSITSSTFTTDITKITSVVSPTPPTSGPVPTNNPVLDTPPAVVPVETVTPSNTAAASYTTSQQFTYTPRDYFVERDGFFGVILYRENGHQYGTYPSDQLLKEGLIPLVSPAGAQWERARQYLATLGIDINSFRHEAWPWEYPMGHSITTEQLPWRTFFGASQKTITAAAFSTNANAAQKTAAKATSTLYDFYTALNSPLPTLADRAKLYENLSLGAASTYVGSADQNNRLLAWLKAAI